MEGYQFDVSADCTISEGSFHWSKDLELNGFIRRNVFMGKPVVVEYELMEYADTVRDVLQALNKRRTPT